MNYPRLKFNWRNTAVQVLAICALFVAPTLFTAPQAMAQEEFSASKITRESYLERPDILSMKPKSSNLGDSWEALKAAHFSFVATLLELYPDRQLYFLARDSEHLYDVARLVTEGTSEASRVHLLNVSRGNMRDPNIKNYLNDNGISESTLTSDRKVLFVDTGFAGTIPRVIAENFSAHAAANMKTQLIVSSNPDHPSSRAFLYRLNPLINEQVPSSMHGTIINYEHMPRYTDRSDRYDRINGKWHPTSLVGAELIDGAVSKKRATLQMQDLKAEWQKPYVQKLFKHERKQARKIITLLTSADRTASIASIQKALNTLPDSALGIFEAVLRDVIGAQLNAGLKIDISLAELGLKADPTSEYAGKNVVIAKNPKWAQYLENPDVGIPKLIAEKNWQLVGTFLDMNIDAEINKLIGRHLFESTGPEIQTELRLAYINSKHTDGWDLRGKILALVSEKEKFPLMQEEVKAILKKDSGVRGDLLQKLPDLQGDFPEQVKGLLLDVVNTYQTDNDELRKIIEKVIGSQNAVKYRDIVMKLIRLPSTKTKYYRGQQELIAQFIFNDPNVALQLRPELNELIKQSPEACYELMQHLFSKPGSEILKDEFKKAVMAMPDYLLRYAAEHVFSKPHSIYFKDVIIPYLNRTPDRGPFSLFFHFFSQPGMAKELPLLKATLDFEKGEPSGQKYLDEYIFNKDFAQTPEHRILRKSLDIPDYASRTLFIETELRKIKSPLASAGRCENVFVGI